jgi:phytoene dehydrogenase-like protein
MIPASGNSSATLKIDMAVGGRVGYPMAEAARQRYDGADIRRTALMTGTFEDQIAQLKAIQRGESIASPPVYMAVLSASDASIAPEGQDVVYLASNMPANPQGGWAGQAGDFTKPVLGSVERYMSGLEHEIGRVITSPADLADRYGATGGCYFHVDMTPFRALKNRPARGLGGYTTPIDGYYLAGAGSHPGGGVSGWPGRLAAETALKHH